MFVHDLLQFQGWAIEGEISSNIELEGLLDEFNKHYSTYLLSDRYSNVAELELELVDTLPAMSRLRKTVEKKLNAGNHQLILDKVWLVETKSSNVNENELPYVPHIDKHRYVKAMVYLDDVNENAGPLNVAIQSPEKYEELRNTLTKDHKKLQQNWIKDIPIQEFTQCTGGAGTVIFFDTNCPHFAGVVKEGAVRRIIRFDFYRVIWRHQSLLSRIKKKIGF